MDKLHSPSTPSPIHENHPLPPPNRRLWSSPAFSQHSDYYSGDDVSAFSPDGSCQKTLEPFTYLSMNPQTLKQQIILERLHGITKAMIASPNLTDHHFHLIDQDIDRLEQTIAAPDSQTREPADIQSGLFVDDDDDLTEVASQRTPQIAPEVSSPSQNLEISKIINRVMQTSEDLKRRFQETKKLHSASETKIHKLENDVAEQEQRNRDLHDELSQYHTDFLYLKLSLKSLEVRVDSQDISPKFRAAHLAEIEKWKSQWKYGADKLRARRRARHSQTPSLDDDASSLRSWGSTKRRALLNNSSKITNEAPFDNVTMNSLTFSQTSPTRSVISQISKRKVSIPNSLAVSKNGKRKQQSNYFDVDQSEELLQEYNVMGIETPSLVKEEISQDEFEESITDIQTEPDIPIQVEPPRLESRKSAWEQLWDDLAEFAGMQDPNE